MEERDLCDITRQAVFLQRVSSSEIEFDINLPDKPIELELDRRLVTQAITNLVKNAIEATEARAETAANGFRGRIGVAVYRNGQWANVDVADNGIGLPKEGRQRLVEPYMTTREKGTGLGLAIVTKIMEEHQGRLSLHDAPAAEDGTSGALIRLSFPVTDATKTAADAEEGDDAQPLVPAG
jgi:two-component system nitrogen regulation sensor histidine kinase NtrY